MSYFVPRTKLEIAISASEKKVPKCFIWWMDGWMDGWVDGWVDGWMGGWMGGL